MEALKTFPLNKPLAWLLRYLGAIDERVSAKCESPIEEGLLVAFEVLRLADRRIRFADWPGGPIATDIEAVIHAQHKVGKYRLDFAVEVMDGAKTLAWIGIECDGHDFHDRTKEQAARDKSRDRELTALGFRMLRFTGSEIHKDNMACALQVYDLILSLGGQK